jgi:hypothetical protein
LSHWCRCSNSKSASVSPVANDISIGKRGACTDYSSYISPALQHYYGIGSVPGGLPRCWPECLAVPGLENADWGFDFNRATSLICCEFDRDAADQPESTSCCDPGIRCNWQRDRNTRARGGFQRTLAQFFAACFTDYSEPFAVQPCSVQAARSLFARRRRKLLANIADPKI